MEETDSSETPRTSAVYDELRGIAAKYLGQERGNHTLQPTALVHEAWIKLAAQDSDAENEAHFRALASMTMRRILVDYARTKSADKRSTDGARLTLAMVVDDGEESAGDELRLLELDAAISKLAELSARQARVVEHRFFGGLSIDETAEALGVSRRTVVGDWRLARAWIMREVSGTSAD